MGEMSVPVGQQPSGLGDHGGEYEGHRDVRAVGGRPATDCDGQDGHARTASERSSGLRRRDGVVSRAAVGRVEISVEQVRLGMSMTTQPATRSSDQPLGTSGDLRRRFLCHHVPLALASALFLFLFMSLPLFYANLYPHGDIFSSAFPQQRGGEHAGPMRHGGSHSGPMGHGQMGSMDGRRPGELAVGLLIAQRLVAQKP